MKKKVHGNRGRRLTKEHRRKISHGRTQHEQLVKLALAAFAARVNS